MDIETLQGYVTLTKDIVTGLSAFTAAIVAILGLRTWRKQLKGKTEYELAQRLSLATYRLRDALAHVRNPVELGVESSREAMYSKRWQKVVEASTKLDTVSLEAEGIWGPAVREYLKPLIDCVGTLYTTILISLERAKHAQISYAQDVANRESKIMYATLSEQDNFFSDEIAMAVGKMEKFLRPRLKI